MIMSQYFHRLYSILLLAMPLLLFGQGEYYNFKQMSDKLKSLSLSGQAKLESYGKSQGNKDLWILKLGADSNPAILLVAGLDGRHQAGTLAAIDIAEKFISTDTLKALLKTKTVYIIPNGNPDAMDAFFAKPLTQKSGNTRKTDDDRNGRFGDDPYNDLNNDGFITMVRVASQMGNYTTHDKDARLMVKADALKDQKGSYLLFTEGYDDNKNGSYNEDPSNGVNIDRNFAFDYPYFKDNSGEYAVSEPETRSLMDFISQNTNIHTVINFGPQNNLTEAQKYDPRAAQQRIQKGWTENDLKVNELVSKSYNKYQSLKNPPALPLHNGSFTQTAYYHAGKYSFSTPVWWATDQIKKDTLSKEKHDPVDKPSPTSFTGMKRDGFGDRQGGSDVYELTLLKWMDKEGLKNLFIDWKEIKHPDFPNHKVEVGGFKPYSDHNPPSKYIHDLSSGHTSFVYDILNKMPTHEIADTKIEKINDNLYRVSVSITNKGLMPSYADVTDKLKYVSRIKTEIKLSVNQSRISGKKIIIEKALQPNDSRTHSWLVAGKGQIMIESGCKTTGVTKISLELK